MDNPLSAILIGLGGLAVGALTGFVGGMMYTTRKLAASEIDQLKVLATGDTAAAVSPELQDDVTKQIKALAVENGLDPESMEGLTYGARKLLEENGMSMFDGLFGSESVSDPKVQA